MGKRKLPNEEEVAYSVCLFIAGFTQLRPEEIDPDWKLRDQQLSFDENELEFLALSLRGYVQFYNDGETITSNDTRKGGLTVKGITEVVDERIRA